VAGHAALYADSRIPERFGAALAEAWTNTELRNRLVEKGLENLQRFSWERTAAQTVDVYHQALGIVSDEAVVA
jgi:glycosyltransferase involved in cell wall biosynthesis